MIGLNPVVTAAQANTSETTSTSSSSQGTSISELGPNAFIMLLTAQLQAQDPLNPMDPNQMVNELTSMNTLQETIQIREDLDALAAAAKGSTAGSGTSSNASAAPSTPAQGLWPSATPPLAAAAMASGLIALTKSIMPGSGSSLDSQTNSKSQLF